LVKCLAHLHRCLAVVEQLGFDLIAWVALGLSILLCALSVRGEVSKAALLAKAAADKAIEQSQRGEAWTSPVTAAKPAIYRWSEVLFYAALIVAVLSLVVHAVLRT
jgi:hypothetical protein